MTLHELLHELTAPWTLPDQPVLVSAYDSCGELVTYQVTGISVRQHGKGVVQVLKLKLTE